MTWDTSMFVALDTETHLIEPGILAPRLVCVSLAWSMSTGERDSSLLDREQGLTSAKAILQNGQSVIVGANLAFDFGVLAAADPSILPLVFRAYSEERVYDILIAQALHAIAEGNLYQDPVTLKPFKKGRYSLDRCVQFVLGRDDAKANDDWRMRYATLDGVPIEEWPAEARQYPLDDAVNALDVASAQVNGFGSGPTPGPHRNLDDLSAQCESAWALHLGAVWGIRTDRARVQTLREGTERAHVYFVSKFTEVKFFDADGKEDRTAVKRAVVRAYAAGEPSPCAACGGDGKVDSSVSGKPINCKGCSGTGLDVSTAPKTPTGGVCADRDAKVESGDAELVAFGDNEPEKIRDTYLPFLEEGLIRPITLRPNVIVASGRTSYDGLIQLLPREGDVRACFVARPGRVFCSVDYAALELCTLAQVCLWIIGWSQMAETINAIGDPGGLHTALAARMIGCTTEEMAAALKSPDAKVKAQAKKFRQAAKALNFGLPGGMGAAKLVFSKRKKSEGSTAAPDGTEYPGIRFCILIGDAERCGVDRVVEWRGRATPAICRACVEIVDRDLKPAWFSQWPEMRKYFDWASNLAERGREFPCWGTSRIRGGCDFTNGANNSFQALAADGAKAALRAVTRECYLDRGSPLYGSRPIFFVHDEIFSELTESQASEAGPRKAQVMVSEMKKYVPDVTVVAEPALMRNWLKAAEPSYRDGKLICWEDRDK